jgi:hypothetical protein
MTERERALAVTESISTLIPRVDSTRPPRGLHMTVAAASGSALNLDDECSQTKAALPDADHVTLLSPKASLFTGVDALSQAGPLEVFEILLSLPPEFTDGLDRQGLATVATAARAALDPRVAASLTKQQRAAAAQIADLLNDQMEPVTAELRAMAAKMTVDAGADELVRARSAGLLTLDSLEPRPSDRKYLDSIGERIRGEGGTWGEAGVMGMVEVLAARVAGLLAEGTSLPVFDSEIADLVRRGLAGDQPTRSGRARARHGNLAAGLLSALPSFPLADMSEILDIRADLAGPLTNFRAAVLDLAAEMHAEAYDEDFAAHVDDVWTARVAPELEAIRAAVVENSYLGRLARLAVDAKGTLAAEAGGLGVVLGVGGRAGVAAGAAIALSTGRRALQAALDREEAMRGTSQRQFWFMYAAERRLGQ